MNVVKTIHGSVRVRLVNYTAWRAGDLMKIVRRVVQVEEVKSGIVAVDVVYGRGTHRWCSGCAGYGSWRVLVRVPHPARLLVAPVFPSEDFAHVVAHEIGHAVFKLHHREMGGHYRRGARSHEVFGWAAAIPVRPSAVPRTKTTDEKRAAKIVSAQKAVTKYQRRLKLDTTLLKKWERKVRELERRAMAATGGGENVVDIIPQVG